MISAGGFLLEVSQGHHGLFRLWALLRLLLFFPNLPLGWCPLLSSVLHPGLFNVIGFSRVGQEFKLLRNISRWFVDIWKGFIDFLAWKPFHNTENILVNLTSLLMNCCSLVGFRSQNRGSVVGKSQDYEVVRRCSNCTLSALSRYFSRSAKRPPAGSSKTSCMIPYLRLPEKTSVFTSISGLWKCAKLIWEGVFWAFTESIFKRCRFPILQTSAALETFRIFSSLPHNLPGARGFPCTIQANAILACGSSSRGDVLNWEYTSVFPCVNLSL